MREYLHETLLTIFQHRLYLSKQFIKDRFWNDGDIFAKHSTIQLFMQVSIIYNKYCNYYIFYLLL